MLQAMKLLYESVINCSVHSEWDAGWTARIGDPMNGYAATAHFLPNEIENIGPWLIDTANRLHPYMIPIKLDEAI